jgi:hypothetical protein
LPDLGAIEETSASAGGKKHHPKEKAAWRSGFLMGN